MSLGRGVAAHPGPPMRRSPHRRAADRAARRRSEELRLTVRLSMALLGTASRLLPTRMRRFAGNAAVAARPRDGTARACRAAARDADDGPRIHRRGIDRVGARARPARPLSSRSAPSMCSAKGRGPKSTRSGISTLMRLPSMRLRSQPPGPVHGRSAISVKLSALEPRYSLTQRARVMESLVPRMLSLARRACSAGIGLTIDAEEADRLDLSLDVIEALASDVETHGLGRSRTCRSGLRQARTAGVGLGRGARQTRPGGA